MIINEDGGIMENRWGINVVLGGMKEKGCLQIK
jgi:hypothetical protein